MIARTLIVLVALFASAAEAILPEPDFLLFGQVSGTPSWLGSGTADGLLLEIKQQGTEVVFATARVAADGNYLLRVPIDSVDPQAPGTSRPGRPLDLYLDGVQLDPPTALLPIDVPATGERGSFVRLDIDLDMIVIGAGFSVLDTQTPENAASGAVNVQIILEGEANGLPQSVNWVTVESTARAASGSQCAPGDDFIPNFGVANFAPGQTVVTVAVQLCNDSVAEDTESFLVRILNPSNELRLIQDEAVVTIIDDDGVPTLAINDISIREPVVGSVPGTFRVSLSAPQPTPVSFNFATEDRTAVAGEDYIAASGVAMIPAGSSQTIIRVEILADDVSDHGERFALVLSQPVGAEIAVAEGIATIIDSAFDGSIIVDDGSNQMTLDGPVDLAVDSSGSWLFVANRLGKSITRFEIDADSGELTNEFRWQQFDLPGADFRNLAALTASNDGNWLLASNGGGNVDGINALALGPDGSLAFAGTASDDLLDANGTPFRGLSGISAFALSPDSAHIYVVSRTGNSVAALGLSTDSVFSMIELEQDGVDDPFDPGVEVRDLEQPSDVIVGGDGTSVYVVSPEASAILHFSRTADPTNAFFGALAFRASYSLASTGASALEGVSRLARSADGQYLHAVSPATGKITTFSIGINGVLTLVGSGETNEPGTLESASAVLASADSASVLAASSTPGALHVFKRQANGDVAAVEVLIAGRDVPSGLAGATALAEAPQRPNRVYVSAFHDNRVSLFAMSVESLIFLDDFED